MMYELGIKYKSSQAVYINTDGRHSLAGFVLDALIHHESGKHPIDTMEIKCISDEELPVRFKMSAGVENDEVSVGIGNDDESNS